jgi:hypothetical protein
MSSDQLEQQLPSLEGASMPDGQTWEKYIMSKGREVDGENSGPS